MLQIITRDLEGSEALPLHRNMEATVKRTIQWEDKEATVYKSVHPLCDEDDTDCEIVAAWQESNNMTCNPIHEIDLNGFFVFGDDKNQTEHIQYIARGGLRETWSFRDFGGPKRALKMLRLIADDDDDDETYGFTPKLLDKHRRDAVVSEVASSSPYIVKMHSYCAYSAVYDFADGGDLDTYLDEKGSPPKDQMLRIADRLASSLADLHQVDESGHAAVLHSDIHTKQWIMIDGEYYLNDFNNALFLTWSRKTNAVIPYPRVVDSNVSAVPCCVLVVA
jgi:hypothetical protein